MFADTLHTLLEAILSLGLSLWPLPTWLVFLVAILGVILALIVAWRWHKSRNLRRFAYAELNSIQAKFNSSHNQELYLQELNLLLRRLAVRSFGRAKVSTLVGADWLEFLDWSLGKPVKNEAGFQNGNGQVLAKNTSEELNSQQLYLLVKRWVRQQT